MILDIGIKLNIIIGNSAINGGGVFKCLSCNMSFCIATSTAALPKWSRAIQLNVEGSQTYQTHSLNKTEQSTND
jgi:predicted transcriptional regulator